MKNTALKSDLFKKLSEKKLIGIKVSFEDEGADFVDLLSIKFFCLSHDIDLTLKIGGPEALRDLKDANKLGVCNIVAPMIESKFALSKYVSGANRIINNSNLKLGFNVETIISVNNFKDISDSNSFLALNSVTVGRGDLVESMELDRYAGSVDSDQIYKICEDVFRMSKTKDKYCMLGGSMTVGSKDFVVNLINDNLLDKFETRNIILHKDSLKIDNFDNLIDLAFEMEHSQMVTRREYYERLFNQDFERIKKLSKKIN